MQKIVTGVIGFDDDFTPGDCERCRFSYYNDDYTSVYCVFWQYKSTRMEFIW